MKHLILLLLFCFVSATCLAQQTLTGQVQDGESGRPVPGVTISHKDSRVAGMTDEKGTFSVKAAPGEGTVTFSRAGYVSVTMSPAAWPQGKAVIKMMPKTAEIREITVSTGYQKLPKERATGAFSQVSREQLQKEVSTNILDRLSAVGNGIVVERGVTGLPQLTVRGLSTLEGPRNPLIVLDDFPYEGDVNNIPPDIIESITILKDAAASSIWGARAANGVIVLTTKKASRSQPLKAEMAATISFTPRPNLDYIRQMSSSDFVAVEEQLFFAGYYDSDFTAPHHPVLTPAVDLLYQHKKGLITPEELEKGLHIFRRQDVREQFRKYMYTPGQKQQYSLNISEGGLRYSWSAGLTYDENAGNLNERYNRKSFRHHNSFRFSDRLNATTELLYTDSNEKSGRNGYGSIRLRGRGQLPYLRFADESGAALPVYATYDQRYKDSISAAGLLDWNYYPLTDWQHSISNSRQQDLLFNSAIHYVPLKGLNTSVRYQYQQNNGIGKTHYDPYSYYARNYINSYAQWDTAGGIRFIIPKGGILDQLNSRTAVNNVRAQADYRYANDAHDVTTLAGAEIRATRISYEQNRYYGYNKATGSFGTVDFTERHPNFVTGDLDYIEEGRALQEKNIRFVSLYANGAYTFRKKYTVSGSLRRDASNLFGLRTNDQWNPFWSAGAAWHLSAEKFYPLGWLPKLKLRASYGYNGNIDPAMVAVTTIFYESSPSMYTGTEMARIDRFYNPNLRWETSRIVNVAVDFSTKNQRISGSVDFFTKKGENLFGNAPLDYTTGITTLLWNIAGMEGKGIDVELNTNNVMTGPFQWTTRLNFSHYRDRVTSYYLQNDFASRYFAAAGTSLPVTGVVGLPVYSVFGYKWAGLDPETGDPRGYLNGEISKDYTAITGSEKGAEDLEYFGSAIPTIYGSLSNTLRYRNFSLDIGLTYKLGYYFRRSSINYTDLIVNRQGHSDFAMRWQQPGDERFTNVPSFTGNTDAARDAFYSGSSVLVEKGDHVRLQYLTLSYAPQNFTSPGLPFQLQLYGSVNNLGLLWRANKQGLDPDYSWGYAALKPSPTFSLGLKAQF